MVSEINRYIRFGLHDDAYALLELYKKHFKDDFYLEIQLNGVEAPNANQREINVKLIEFGKASGTKIILTGDVHYNEKGDGSLQDIIMAIGQGKKLNDPKLFTLDARDLHFQSREDYYEMNEKYNYNYSKEFIDECLDNTLEISDKVDFGFKKTKHYPKFHNNIEDSKTQFKKLVTDGLREYIRSQNMNKEKVQIYKDRVKYEYDVIIKNGYTDYLLIVWDVIRFCREQKIAVGVGRGSAGSSLIMFLLGVVGLDPLEYNLFFERFINPQALSDPDVDMDIC